MLFIKINPNINIDNITLFQTALPSFAFLFYRIIFINSNCILSVSFYNDYLTYIIIIKINKEKSKRKLILRSRIFDLQTQFMSPHFKLVRLRNPLPHVRHRCDLTARDVDVLVFGLDVFEDTRLGVARVDSFDLLCDVFKFVDYIHMFTMFPNVFLL